MTGSKMFSFITKCWNPVCMRCQYACSYCWSEALKNGRLKESPRYKELALMKLNCYLVEKELHKHFKAGDYVFVEDCGDLFGWWVPERFIYEVMKVIEACPEAKFLLLTKNPARMYEYKFPENVLCGCTIETNRSVKAWSKAPTPSERFRAMKGLSHNHKMLCLEPIMDFDKSILVAWIQEIHPELVVIGYNNYPQRSHLPEPSLKKTKALIQALSDLGFPVQTKTLREKIQ